LVVLRLLTGSECYPVPRGHGTTSIADPPSVPIDAPNARFGIVPTCEGHPKAVATAAFWLAVLSGIQEYQTVSATENPRSISAGPFDPR
jgi:hypothetical protein